MKIKSRSGPASGFTLIELLVVVSVIALLLAILLPSLSLAHESGNMAVCGTQLNQLYNGSFHYAVENEDRIPYFAYLSGRGSLPEWWATQVAQAIGQFEAEIYTCPSDKNPHTNVSVYYNGATISMVKPRTVAVYKKGKNIVVTGSSRSVVLPITYRGSCDLTETNLDTGALEARKMTSWARPTEAIMLIEASAQGPRECFRFMYHMGALDMTTKGHFLTSRSWAGWDRHLGQANYLFLDGHVDTLMPYDAGLLANKQEYAVP